VILLTETTLAEGVQELCRRDPDLARIVGEFGFPPLWVREPGFQALIAIILEQQVSLASARAAFGRLLEVASPLTPERFLTLDDAMLKACGFSRQKTVYGRSLAETVLAGRLDLAGLAQADDAAVHAALISLKGIGHWSAEVYLMMALRRIDIWPKGDRALVVAARRVKGLSSYPTLEEMERLGEAWRPWRSVAAHLLWHEYLSRRALPLRGR
jgi:DNA-3-methyladenine glycosylase II